MKIESPHYGLCGGRGQVGVVYGRLTLLIMAGPRPHPVTMLCATAAAAVDQQQEQQKPDVPVACQAAALAGLPTLAGCARALAQLVRLEFVVGMFACDGVFGHSSGTSKV